MLCSNSLLIQTIVVSRTLWPRFATQVFTGGCEPPVRGRGGRRRLERGPMSSPVVTSYRLPMVTIGVTLVSFTVLQLVTDRRTGKRDWSNKRWYYAPATKIVFDTCLRCKSAVVVKLKPKSFQNYSAHIVKYFSTAKCVFLQIFVCPLDPKASVQSLGRMAYIPMVG